MGVLRLEVGREPRTSRCQDCGGTVTTTAGFIYEDGDALAVYNASLFGAAHAVAVDLGIGIGSWVDDAAVASASAFLRLWPEGDQIQFGFVDPTDSTWANAKLLRNHLLSDVARREPNRGEFMRLAELVAREDPAVCKHIGS